MLEAISPRNRTLTLIFLAACGVFAIGAAAIGVSDNLPGILLAYLAATAFVLACVHPWRTEKQFRFLAAGSVLGLVILVGLSAILDVVAKRWATVGVLHSLLQGLSVAAFLLALMLCPPAFLVSAGGGVALGLRDRRRSKQARGTGA